MGGPQQEDRERAPRSRPGRRRGGPPSGAARPVARIDASCSRPPGYDGGGPGSEARMAPVPGRSSPEWDAVRRSGRAPSPTSPGTRRAARLGPRDADAAGGRRVAGAAARHARRPAPPRAGPRRRGRGDRRPARGRRRARRRRPGDAAPRAARARDRALRVPEALVREITEACSRCVSAWIEARKADDFAAFAGPLRRVRRAQAPPGRGHRRRRRALRRPPRRVRAGRPGRRARAGLRRPARAPDPDRRRGLRGGSRPSCRRGTGPRTARWPSRTTSRPWWGSTRPPA